MSVDEVVALIVAGLIAGARWLAWYTRAAKLPELVCPTTARWPLYLTPPAAAALLLGVLLFFSASDVRDSPVYLPFYMVIGAAWVSLAAGLLPLTGLRAHEDILERRNRAAGVATAGAVLGLTLCFAGGNIGDGPGWWVVLFSGALSTVGFFALWAAVNALAGTTEVVTMDRDRAAGIRLAAFLIAGGAIQGRAVAGDWISAGATVADWLRVGWPAVGLVVMEIVVGRMHRASSMRGPVPVLGLGLLPGAAYILGAWAYIVLIGWWT